MGGWLVLQQCGLMLRQFGAGWGGKERAELDRGCLAGVGPAPPYPMPCFGPGTGTWHKYSHCGNGGFTWGMGKNVSFLEETKAPIGCSSSHDGTSDPLGTQALRVVLLLSCLLLGLWKQKPRPGAPQCPTNCQPFDSELGSTTAVQGLTWPHRLSDAALGQSNLAYHWPPNPWLHWFRVQS